MWPPPTHICLVMDYSSSFPKDKQKSPGRRGPRLTQSPTDLAGQGRPSVPELGLHLSAPVLALHAQQCRATCDSPAHHASSGLSTYAQAVPSDKIPSLHLPPIHPSWPQAGRSVKTAVYPDPTSNRSAPSLLWATSMPPTTGEAIEGEV